MIKLYKMKNLQAIIKKYSEIEHNQDNYEIGGGLSNEKFNIESVNISQSRIKGKERLNAWFKSKFESV